MKVAIVYDRVNKWGGAERVLLALNELFPEAPLFTSVYSSKHAPWANIFPKVETSFLQKVPFAKRKHELFPLIMPLAFESMNFDDYDLVLSVTSEAAKGVITRGKTKHICYCLTPTRYLWSGYQDYFNAGGIGQKLTKPLVSHLRRWDLKAAHRPDVMVAISKAVQDRIKKYYGRESEIVHPPVDVERFTIQDLGFKKKSNYFLVVSRLVSYKKVELAVEVFNELGLPLVIVGKGAQERKIRRMAGANVKMVRDVDDTELAEIYRNAKALIFPQEEDFGMTSVEAQAAGIPVIAYKKGGALDSIIEGKTGIFFIRQDKISLKAAIQKSHGLKFKKKDLVENAKKFSKEKFKKRLLKVVGKVM